MQSSTATVMVISPELSVNEDTSTPSQKRHKFQSPPHKRQAVFKYIIQMDTDKHINKTSINLEIANWYYACNIPVNAPEHPH